MSSWLKVVVKISPCQQPTAFGRLAIYMSKIDGLQYIGYGDGRCVLKGWKLKSS
jgi:hypothetical protein